ncbi:MAG: DNA-processing protein DprA, partial [Actinomycetota bacterium]
RKWVPDPGWTGDWAMPELLRRPLTAAERGGLVALSGAGMGPGQLARALARARRMDHVLGDFLDQSRAALRLLSRQGARAVVPSDDEYPDELGAIDAPPPLLYVRGGRLDELRPAVAIVGARACTAGAARFARRLGSSFAAAGFVVVSGLARGIDAAAHEGALEAGRTVAVLGTGIDVCYPSEHADLASRIAADGALVTEFPPGVGPRAWHFPARNRIISGLSLALVIVEAGTTSGALITAGFALDQGREVFACTTGPENPAGAGVRELLKDGAQLIVDAEQAVEVVTGLAVAQEFTFGRPTPPVERVLALDAELGRIYDAITEECTVDEVAANASLPPARVASGLAELELDGLVAVSSGRWRRQ